MTNPAPETNTAPPSPGDPAADSPQTPAQEAEEARVEGGSDAAGVPQPSQEQVDQQNEDAARRVANPNEVVGREGNPAFGGESFLYGPEKSAAEAKENK